MNLKLPLQNAESMQTLLTKVVDLGDHKPNQLLQHVEQLLGLHKLGGAFKQLFLQHVANI